MRSPVGAAAQDRVEHGGPWPSPGFGGAEPGRRRHCDGAADGAWAVAHGRTMENVLEESAKPNDLARKSFAPAPSASASAEPSLRAETAMMSCTELETSPAAAAGRRRQPQRRNELLPAAVADNLRPGVLSRAPLRRFCDGRS